MNKLLQVVFWHFSYWKDFDSVMNFERGNITYYVELVISNYIERI